MNLKIRTALFDLDGTLVDSEPLKAKALSLATSSFGVSVEPYIYKQVMGKSWEEVTNHFFRNTGKSIALDKFNPVFRQHYEHLIDTELAVRNGVQDFLLKSLERKIRCAVVSSASRWMIDRILKKAQLDCFFDLIISREDVEQHKPHPEAYLFAMRKYAVDANDVLVFEDSEAGVEASRAAGCRFVFLEHDFNTQHNSDGALLRTRNFSDVWNLICYQ